MLRIPYCRTALRFLVWTTCGFAFATAASAATFIDTFDGGTSTGGWAFNPGADEFPTTGGNPGTWLHNPLLDTFSPILRTGDGVASAFTGDLRAKQVTSIGVDARVDHTDFGASGEGFQLTLLLRDTKGTLFDPTDDDYAYSVGGDIPQPGQGWLSYDYNVPSQPNDDVPPGWLGGSADDPVNFRPGVTWSDVITHVDSVEFWFLNPTYFAIFQQWDVGADNPRVTYVPEPSGLAGLGVAGVAVAVRRRRGC